MLKLAAYSLLAGAVFGLSTAGLGYLAVRLLLVFFLVVVLIAAAKDRIARRSCR